MKKKYEEIIYHACDNMKKIPLAISGYGSASTSVESYISAYRDLEPAWNWICTILDDVRAASIYEKQKKEVPEYDREELQGAIDYHLENINRAMEAFDAFVEKRSRELWR